MRRATIQNLLGILQYTEVINKLGLDGSARTIGVSRHTSDSVLSAPHAVKRSHVRSIFHRHREHQEIHG